MFPVQLVYDRAAGFKPDYLAGGQDPEHMMAEALQVENKWWKYNDIFKKKNTYSFQ